MKWYKLDNSTEIKEIGKAYPQIDNMGSHYNLKGPDSVWNLKSYNKPDFIPNLNYFQLDKKAKLTDVISTGFISANGFLINEKVKYLFEKYVLPEHAYYKAVIKVKESISHNYSWLQFTKSNDNLIDFKNSIFLLTHPLPFFRTEEIKVEGKEYDEILLIKKQFTDYRLFPLKIKLSGHVAQDLYSFSTLYNENYIGENLAQAIFEKKISGFSAQGVSINILY